MNSGPNARCTGLRERQRGGGTELRCVSFFQLLPRHHHREEHPAVIRTISAAKGQIVLLDCQPAVILLAIHVR